MNKRFISLKKKLLKICSATGNLVLGLSVFALFIGFDARAQVFNENAEQATKANLRWGQKAENVNIKNVENTDKSASSSRDKQEIVLFMSDFQIRSGLGGQISCLMKFHVYNALKSKLSNISYRLKWPEMETPLSFDNIEPNTAQYRTYALLGQGCYSMDKIPNIIVNRCRVKNLSQAECASYIRWEK